MPAIQIAVITPYSRNHDGSGAFRFAANISEVRISFEKFFTLHNLG